MAEKFGATIEQVCLIFAGKILKDQETLKGHNLKDGLTVHLVLKNKSPQDSSSNAANSAPQPPTTAPTRPTEPSSSSPFGIGGLGGLAGWNKIKYTNMNFSPNLSVN